MQRTLLALALIASVGVSYAQAQTTVVTTTQTRPQAMPANEPLDPYGHPLIGRNDWVAQPGDRTNAGAAPSMHRREHEPGHGPGAVDAERPASGHVQGRVWLPL